MTFFGLVLVLVLVLVLIFFFLKNNLITLLVLMVLLFVVVEGEFFASLRLRLLFVDDRPTVHVNVQSPDQWCCLQLDCCRWQQP